MRTLVLFRGAPGCGKSTFIDNHGWRPYALSADELRLLCQSSQQNIYGEEEISCNNEKDVWAMLFKLLDIRMSRGEFTVIDATNSKSTEMNRYKEMADHYRYRIFCIDMTDLPIEECKKRNSERIPLKKVPEDAIDKMYARFKNQRIPSGIKVLKPSEWEEVYVKQFDLTNKFNKIVHIGDIHGCYTALMEYFKDGFKDDTLYIFLGDYIDRGIENAETVKFFIEASKRKNVLLLEGNHERWLWIYANGGIGRSKEFELVTKDQLTGIDTKEIRQLYRKLGQFAWYKFDDKEVLVTHGGIANIPKNFTFMSTEQMIKGVGKYDDFETISETWDINTNANQYQIFGHRNTKNSPTKISDKCFNLEGKVEFGGDLRIIELDHSGFHEVSIKNTVFKAPEEIEATKQVIESTVAETVISMRNNKFIQEKKFGNISSFNFTKDAFYDKVWNEQTMTARGLYINTNNMKIVARGFNKFFNINERPETKLEMLQYTLQFPVTCYIKENGFLGLVSYNEETDDLFITTKSNPDGDYALWLKEMIYNKMKPEAIDRMKTICKNENITLVFECVDMKNDPHIIEYPESELFLLSAIKNDLKFQQYEYNNVVNIACQLNVKVKTRAFEISDWQEFYDWYTEITAEDYEYDGNNIEGFVIEDANGYMVKVKLYYYNFWKFMRSVAHTTLRCGYFNKTGSLTTAEANNFYGFCQKLYNETAPEQRELIPKDIVYLRNQFLNQKGN